MMRNRSLIVLVLATVTLCGCSAMLKDGTLNVRWGHTELVIRRVDEQPEHEAQQETEQEVAEPEQEPQDGASETE